MNRGLCRPHIADTRTFEVQGIKESELERYFKQHKKELRSKFGRNQTEIGGVIKILATRTKD